MGEMKITVGALPPRARSVGTEELRDVFGGCSGATCERDSDCCPGHNCTGYDASWPRHFCQTK